MKAYTIEQLQSFFRTVNCMGFDDEFLWITYNSIKTNKEIN